MEPAGGGGLTGGYKRADKANTGRKSGAYPSGDSKFSDRDWEVLANLEEVAVEPDPTPAQITLAWVMVQRGVTSTLIGACGITQLRSNTAACEVTMKRDQMDRLAQVGARPSGFSASLTTPLIRRIVYGGPEVAGWMD